MNAVTTLAEEMEKQGILSQKKIKPLLEEFNLFHSILQQFIDIFLDVQNKIQLTYVPFLEYPVIQDIEKAEDIRDREKNSVPSEVNNFLITVGSLKISSLANTMGETFKEFKKQTTTLADIYNPLTQPELSHIVQVPQYTVSGNRFENTYGIGFEGEPDIRSNNSIINSLNRSANILHNLDSIKTSIIKLYSGQDIPTPGTPDRQGLPSTRILSENSIDANIFSGSDLSNFLSTSSDRMNTYQESLNTIFTGLNEMRVRSERVAAMPYPKLIGERPSIRKESPLIGTDIGSLGSLSSRIPDEVVPDFTNGSKKPGGRSSNKQITSIGTGIIEIPALLPTGKINLPSYDTTINALQFSEGMRNQYSGETGTPVLLEESKRIPSLIRTVPQRLDYSLPSISVPNAFEKISEYLTYISEIHHQITSPLHDNMSTGEFNPPGFSLIMPLPSGNVGIPQLSNMMSYGVNSMSAEQNPILNLAMNVMPGDVMRRADLLAPLVVGTAQHSLYPTEMFHEASLASAPRALDNVLQMFSGSLGETAAPSSIGSNTFHFQNTFNIVVNTKAAGDESGLRELGRKIGLILSEEMKRYGGLR